MTSKINPSGASVAGDRRRHARARRPARGTRVAVHKATLPAPPSTRRNQKDGAAWPRSLQLDLGMRPSPPRDMPTRRSRQRPYVRAARQAADRDKRSMNRRPRHSPAHLQFRAGVSPRLTSDRCAPRGRQKIPGIPISPGGPACSHPLTSSRHELMPSSVARWRGVWRVRKKRG